MFDSVSCNPDNYVIYFEYDIGNTGFLYAERFCNLGMIKGGLLLLSACSTLVG